MSGLLKLAQRCEKAADPDRELDVLIEIECGADGKKISSIMAGSPHNTIEALATAADREDTGAFYRVPRYTASLDAAMTLVPEGMYPMIDCDPRMLDPVEIYRTDEPIGAVAMCHKAANLALALCAAVLKARASL